MPPFLIKYAGKHYCYFKKELMNLPFLLIFDYLIHNQYIVEPEVINTYHLLKSKCNVEYVDNMLEYLYFEASQYKLFTGALNEQFSLTDIKNNYFSLLEVQQLTQFLLDKLTPFKDMINQLINLDLKSISCTQYENKKQFYIHWKTCQFQQHLKNGDKDAILEMWAKEFDYSLYFPSDGFDDFYKVAETLNQHITEWQKVLDVNGEPLEIEDNSTVEHFGQKKSYAIFFKQGNNTAFWDERHWLMSIGGAKLFESEEEAKKAIIKHGLEGAIIEVEVHFSKIIENTSHIDLSHLEQIVAIREKITIEKNNSLELATQLLNNIDSDDVFYEQLKQFITSQEKNNLAPKQHKRKI